MPRKVISPSAQWMHKGSPVTEILDDHEGFIYLIVNETLGGKFYIGRKSFWSYSKKRLTPKEKLLPENKRKTFKITQTETKWRSYTGSCKELNDDIKRGHKITKTILRFCKTRRQMTAWETKYIICECFGDNSKENYNGNIGGKIFKIDYLD